MEFIKYLKEERERFAKVASKYNVTDHLELRTSIDSLLIAYDQAQEKCGLHVVGRPKGTVCNSHVFVESKVNVGYRVCINCYELHPIAK